MSRDISEIPGLSGKTLVLFRASGFVNAESLVHKSAHEIERVLHHTNEEFRIVGWLPSPRAVNAWRETARLLEDAGPEDAGPLTEDELAGVRESAVLVARPVLGVELKEAGVVVDAIPIARFVGDPPKSLLSAGGVTHLRTTPKKRRSRPKPSSGGPVEAPEVGGNGAASEAPVDESKRGVGVAYGEALMPRGGWIGPDHDDDERPGGAPPEAADSAREQDDDPPEPMLSFRDTESLAALNKNTERRNNGMTHKSPRRAYWSAVVTLLTMVVGWGTLLTVIGLAIYFAINTGTMPVWVLWIIPVIPVCLILYLTVGMRARCRLCGYRLFGHLSCRKHEKSHRSIFGSIFATAMRVVVRGTWRCMYCGTKQKLK